MRLTLWPGFVGESNMIMRQENTRRPHKSRRRGAIHELLVDALRLFHPESWRRSWPKFDAHQGDAARAFFDQHGWVVFRQVFSAAEIRDLRERVSHPSQRAHAGDILSSPLLAGKSFILDPRIVGIVRQLLSADPCYFGDSTVSVDVRTMGFHKDNPDRDVPAAPDWQGDYTQLRMGLYLQDHAKHSGGLAIRDRSHLTADRTRGCPLAVSTAVGDLVVWSLRTTHSGNAMRLRFAPHAFVPVTAARWLERRAPAVVRKVMRPLGVDERMALFASFGINDRHLQRYLQYLSSRQYAVQSWQASPAYGADVLQAAIDQGVELISMQERVRSTDIASLNVQHVSLPST